MVQESYQRSVNILKLFDSSTNGLQVQLYQPGIVNPNDRIQTLRYYGFLTSLRARINIKSIAEAVLPELPNSATRTDKLIAARDLEWKQPRMALEILARTSIAPWLPLFEISLQNRLPYYQVDLMPYLTSSITFDMGNDFILAGRILDQGWGLLRGKDLVTLFGSVKEEVTTIPHEAPEVTITEAFTQYVDRNSTLLRPANPARKQLTLTNRSDAHDAYINYGGIAEFGKGICLKRGGGSYEINQTNLYRGAIAAISDYPIDISGIEGM